jgi:hypothetical protein
MNEINEDEIIKDQNKFNILHNKIERNNDD